MLVLFVWICLFLFANAISDLLVRFLLLLLLVCCFVVCLLFLGLFSQKVRCVVCFACVRACSFVCLFVCD